MCGIVGAFPLNKTDLDIDPKLRRQIALFIHNEILFETVARGKDATGVSVAFGPPVEPNENAADYFWAALKQPVDTADFFLNDGTSSRYNGQDEQANLERFMDASSAIQRPLRHIIGHTRAKTVGTEFNPLNNHPILVGKIIGIHNGGVKNYKKIYEKHKKMTPQGEVDSEVIMQLLAEKSNGRALGEKDIKYVTERIMGPRAVIAYNRDFPDKVIYFHDSERPLELAYIEELGLAVICSERRFFNRAMHVYHRASLTLKRSLPQLTVKWRDVPNGEGGVIDVAEAIEGDWDVKELFPLVKCSSVINAYDPNPTSYHKPSATHNIGTKTGVNNHAAANAKKKTNSTDIPDAELTDITQFGYGSDADSAPDEKTVSALKTIVASAVMDDNSEDEGPEEEEEYTNINDVYSDPELVKKGIEYIMSAEGRANEDLLIVKHEGAFSRYLAQTPCEEDAAEIVNQLFPEAFGEGYAVGFKGGVEEQIGLQDDDNVMDITDKIEELEEKVKAQKVELAAYEDNARKSAAFIANMKAFIMASILVKNLARVEGEGTAAELVFDDDLEQFLGTARGFTKSNPEMVRDIFNQRDLQTISTSMVRLSKEVAKETVSSSTAELAAMAKSIKS
jgi:hypothetical protein